VEDYRAAWGNVEPFVSTSREAVSKMRPTDDVVVLDKKASMKYGRQYWSIDHKIAHVQAGALPFQLQALHLSCNISKASL